MLCNDLRQTWLSHIILSVEFREGWLSFICACTGQVSQGNWLYRHTKLIPSVGYSTTCCLRVESVLQSSASSPGLLGDTPADNIQHKKKRSVEGMFRKRFYCLCWPSPPLLLMQLRQCTPKRSTLKSSTLVKMVHFSWISYKVPIPAIMYETYLMRQNDIEYLFRKHAFALIEVFKEHFHWGRSLEKGYGRFNTLPTWRSSS